jgi:hypothetical protein
MLFFRIEVRLFSMACRVRRSMRRPKIPPEFLFRLCQLDEGMRGAGREIHDDIDITVGTKMIGGDRSEDLEFFDVPCPAELLDLFLPAPDESVHGSRSLPIKIR